MKNEVFYEYGCEYVMQNCVEDIDDVDFSSKASDIWPARWDYPDCEPRLVARRMWGNDLDGLLEVGYAYKGDTHFDTGQKVPAHMLRMLSRC